MLSAWEREGQRVDVTIWGQTDIQNNIGEDGFDSSLGMFKEEFWVKKKVCTVQNLHVGYIVNTQIYAHFEEGWVRLLHNRAEMEPSRRFYTFRYSDRVELIQRCWRMYWWRSRMKWLIGLRLLIVRTKTMWKEWWKGIIRVQKLFRGRRVRRQNADIVM